MSLTWYHVHMSSCMWCLQNIRFKSNCTIMVCVTEPFPKLLLKERKHTFCAGNRADVLHGSRECSKTCVCMHGTNYRYSYNYAYDTIRVTKKILCQNTHAWLLRSDYCVAFETYILVCCFASTHMQVDIVCAYDWSSSSSSSSS